MEKYIILGNEIAIGTESTLNKLYPNYETFPLPADYYERKYIVRGGTLVIDTDVEKSQKIDALTAEYRQEKANLCEAYTTASMQGDTETAQSVAADMADLDEWYDEEYQKIERSEDNG